MLYNGKYVWGGGKLGYHRQPGKSVTKAIENCNTKCKQIAPAAQSFLVYKRNNYWKGRCWCTYAGKGDRVYTSNSWNSYEFTPRRGQKEVCNAKSCLLYTSPSPRD